MTSPLAAPDARIVVAIGCLILLIGVVVRAWQSWRWHRSLVALSLRLPHGLSVEDIAAWLGTVHSHTTASRWRLVPGPPIVWEVLATRHGIRHLLLIPEVMRAGVLAGLQASFPGIRAENTPDDRATRPRLAVELRLSTFRRPLAIERATATATAFLAALQPLYGAEEIRVQWLLSGAATPPVIRIPRHTSRQTGLPWWVDSQAPPDADDIRAQRAKHTHLLLHACARIGVAAATRSRARALLGRVFGPLRMMNAGGYPPRWPRGGCGVSRGRSATGHSCSM